MDPSGLRILTVYLIPRYRKMVVMVATIILTMSNQGDDESEKSRSASPLISSVAYAKLSLKKYSPIAARNEDKKVCNGLR